MRRVDFGPCVVHACGGGGGKQQNKTCVETKLNPNYRFIHTILQVEVNELASVPGRGVWPAYRFCKGRTVLLGAAVGPK